MFISEEKVVQSENKDVNFFFFFLIASYNSAGRKYLRVEQQEDYLLFDFLQLNCALFFARHGIAAQFVLLRSLT